MLALKKKREAEKKAQEEAAKNGESTPGAAAPGGQVSLFGIGGEKKSKKGETTGTKKSPGEIRIQKGNFLFTHVSNLVFHNIAGLTGIVAPSLQTLENWTVAMWQHTSSQTRTI